MIGEKIEPSVLGATEKIGDVIAVEVDHRGADIMALDIFLRERPDLSHDPVAIAELDLLQKVGVGRVDEQIEAAVAVPIGDAELAAAAAAGGLGTEPQRPARLVHEGAAGGLEHEAAVSPGPLEEGEEALGVEDRQVDEAVPVEIMGQRGGPPLREQSPARRPQPAPGERWLRAFPRHLDRLRGGEFRGPPRADVLQSLHRAGDRVEQNVGPAVAVPVGDGERRIAPLRLGWALDAAIARHDPEHLAPRLEPAGGGPLHWGRFELYCLGL